MGKSRNKKRLKAKKRNYNTMIAEEEQKTGKKENIDDENKMYHKKKAKLPEKDDKKTEDNIFLNFPFEIDKTNVPPNEFIKNNASNRKSN